MSQTDKRKGVEGRAWINRETPKVLGSETCEMWGLMVEWWMGNCN